MLGGYFSASVVFNSTNIQTFVIVVIKVRLKEYQITRLFILKRKSIPLSPEMEPRNRAKQVGIVCFKGDMIKLTNFLFGNKKNAVLPSSSNYWQYKKK